MKGVTPSELMRDYTLIEIAEDIHPPCVLTVAGSDSGGGAGVQADIKAFAALGVHGMAAVTALTAQNTRSVSGVLPVSPEFVVSQMQAVYTDIGIDATKTGMLHDSDIILAVSKFLKSNGLRNIVVDPVMVSKSQARLLQVSALKALKENLLPLATIVTPNAEEARELVNTTRITRVEHAKSAAREIAELGPSIVVVKGGHLHESKESVDVVYYKETEQFEYLKSPRLKTKNTHGTGCVFSSAIAAELAKGRKPTDALRLAKTFVTDSIKHSVNVGRGSGPVNPVGNVYELAQRFEVLSNLTMAVNILESNGSKISRLIPELRTNIGMAIENPTSFEDIAAIPGRITSISLERVRAVACPEFGASRHIANSILAALKFNHKIRAAMNIKYDPEILSASKRLGLVVASYDRNKEPKSIKRREGSSTFWGAHTAISGSRQFPDLIYHKGDFGKEPMIVLFGPDAVSVAQTAAKLGEMCV